jgi:hypothetical protein
MPRMSCHNDGRAGRTVQAVRLLTAAACDDLRLIALRAWPDTRSPGERDHLHKPTRKVRRQPEYRPEWAAHGLDERSGSQTSARRCARRATRENGARCSTLAHHM